MHFSVSRLGCRGWEGQMCYLHWHHHAFGVICSRRCNWKSAPDCYASPLTGAGARCQERQVQPQRHERGARLASAFQSPKSVWVQPDSWPTPEHHQNCIAQETVHLRGPKLKLGKQPWNNDNNKQLKTQPYIWLCEAGEKHQSNGHLVTHECGSDSSQRLLAGRISIPELGQSPGGAHITPHGQDSGGHRCSIWLQCQNQDLSKFLSEAIPNSITHKFAQTLLKLHLYIQPRPLLEIMSFRRLPAVLSSTSVSYNKKKKELGVKQPRG